MVPCDAVHACQSGANVCGRPAFQAPLRTAGTWIGAMDAGCNRNRSTCKRDRSSHRQMGVMQSVSSTHVSRLLIENPIENPSAKKRDNHAQP